MNHRAITSLICGPSRAKPIGSPCAEPPGPSSRWELAGRDQIGKLADCGASGASRGLLISGPLGALAGVAMVLCALMLAAGARANTIATIAGDPLISGQATAVGQDPNSLVVAKDGTVYVADARQGLVREIDPTTEEESVVAGDGGLPANGAHAFSAGSPTLATATALQPQALTLDAGGDLVIGDGNSARPGGLGLLAASNCSSSCPFGLPSMTKGEIYALAGGGLSGKFPGNGEPGNSAAVEPTALTTDSSGDIVIAQDGCPEGGGECGGAVSLLAASNCSSSCPFGLPSMIEGDIYTIAGGGEQPMSDGEVATAIALHPALGVVVDGFGDLVVATEKVGEINGVGSVQIVAGSSCAGTCPYGFETMTAGDIYTIAGGGSSFPGNNGEPAANVELHPAGVSVDSAGDVLIGDDLNARARLVARASCSSACPFGLATTSAGDIYTIAGGGSSLGDGGPATSAHVDPVAFATDGSGDLLLADRSGNRVRLLASAACASSCPFGLASTSAGDIYTVAGDGLAYSGDDGPASAAQLSSPSGIIAEAVPNGSVFFDDAGDDRVAMIAGAPDCLSGPCGFGLASTSQGDIYTVAGGGTSADVSGTKATSAEIFNPEGLTHDARGDLIFSTVTGVILLAKENCSSACPFGLASMSEGDIYVIAGDGSDTASGEEGPATEAGLGNPAGAIAVDESGDLLIGSPQAQAVRMVAAADCSSNCPFGLAKTVKGDIYKIAGGGSGGSGSPANDIELFAPSSIAVDSSGDALVAESDAGVVWLIADTNCSSDCPFGLSSTERGHAYVVAGKAGGGPVGNGVPATSVFVGEPEAITLDGAGNLLIFQAIDPAVRMVADAACPRSCPYGLASTASGDIYLVAGDESTGFGGDGGSALDAELNPVEFHAAGLAVTSSGNLLISDTGNNRVRSVAAEAGPGGGAEEPPGGEGPKEETKSKEAPGESKGEGATGEGAKEGTKSEPKAESANSPPASTARSESPPQSPSSPEPPPVLGQSQTASPIAGTVTVRVKGTNTFVALSSAGTIPNGSEVEATKGRVLITVATPTGKTQSAEVYGGRFLVEQSHAHAGETRLTLSQPLTGCPRVKLPHGSAATVASAHHRSGSKSRHLWVSEGGGSWGTNGRYVSTSVEGTHWLTLDECNRSEVKVVAGRVKVRNLINNRTKIIATGQTYTAAR